MKNLLCVFLFTSILANAQTGTLKMGGVTFVNCKSVVTFAGQELVGIHPAADGTWLLNAEIYNEAGKWSASIRDNQTSAKGVIITPSAEGVLLTDRYTGRKLCQFIAVKSADGKSIELATTLNLYLPNGTLLQCTPDASNQTVLETMRGAIIQNKAAALQLN